MVIFGRQFRTPYCTNQCSMLGQRGQQKLGRHLKPKCCAKKRRFEPREAPRVVLTRALSRRGHSSRRLESVRGDSLRNLSREGETPRTMVRLVPRMEQGCHAVPQAEVQNDEARKQLISNLTRLNEPEKNILVEEVLISNSAAYKPMSANAEEIIGKPSKLKHSNFVSFYKKFNASAVAREEWHWPRHSEILKFESMRSRLTKLRFEVLTSSNVQEGQ